MTFDDPALPTLSAVSSTVVWLTSRFGSFDIILEKGASSKSRRERPKDRVP